MQDIYIVWKKYQRRAEVFAPLLNAELVFIPHVFRRKIFRPFDYLFKLIITIKLLLRKKPKCAFIQSPPLYAALPALLTGTPYVVDAHNAVWQNFWGKLPLSSMIINKAQALIAHNNEIQHTAGKMYPHKKLFIITDPIEKISTENAKRINRQLLIICSFDSDEPIDTIVEMVETLSDYSFIIKYD